MVESSQSKLRSQLEELEIVPSKSKGQNFLYIPSTINKIIRLAGVKSTDVILEIGPGLGAITEKLSQTNRVFAYEIDRKLFEYLGNLFKNEEKTKANRQKLTILNQDFLEVEEINPEINKVVANLPYNVAVPIILKILVEFPQIESMTLMVQKEVAERLSAQSSTKQYGIPSVKVQFLSDVSIASQISKNVFFPKPNVDSVIIQINRKKDLKYSKDFVSDYFAFIDQSFQFRRKTLQNNLKQNFPKIAEVLERLQLNPSIRPENLTSNQFSQILQLLNN